MRSTSNCLHNVLKSKKVSVITAERENMESDKEEMVKHNQGLWGRRMKDSVCDLSPNS